MPWLQLALIADRKQASLIEAALENGGALAVTIDAANDVLVAEQILEPAPNVTPLWRRVRITALFDDDPQGTMQAENAAAALVNSSLAPPRISVLDDRPWERVWLEELEPMRFGRRLWVCPHGQRPEIIDAENLIIDLDPGLAFGTGHHPTTALCLRWLDGLPLQGLTLLDFGCGSGILSIAALKLGARYVFAVDHDRQAMGATVDNARMNGVMDRLTVTHPEQMSSIAADVIVANILAGPLLALAPKLIELSSAEAQIGLSGILAHQASQVAAAYAEHFMMQPPEIDSDWVLLTGKRLPR
ncbi:MAG TPA: 50S ribosomal protein L11 methyltransferase [Chromatiaceae bacterium]|jgi:ribosomal protein L11 methyltransferase|nr:MAG: hypothetical protein N838_09865 [Thiohalocapsa sp. PB-PSB1]QQO54744.1 MAG: 50S ribosomal protein L11 methyltransferase [Thiohalocapsa sp. PB-PSB1]HBG96340.1 50S ribosomal protein L11 methyltransferase [Chromatiaceae bacterium]HCS90628.1 50S ribosomal protein L11 methyltransferase [Chromatiaceae bacterium]